MKIESVDLATIAVRISQYPTDEKPEFLLVGRSNVGKSSFINAIIGRKNYARTSSKPGKTQTLNFYLVNVPGYGFASVSKKVKQKFGLMIEEYLQNRKNLKRVFMLIDYRHKPTEDDLIMYNYLKHFDIPVTVIATKYDKINTTKRPKQDKIVKDTMDIAMGDDLIFFSSLTKKGREAVYTTIKSYLEEGQ